jgi:hypothetical protein
MMLSSGIIWPIPRPISLYAFRKISGDGGNSRKASFFFFVKMYLQEVNTHTSGPDSTKIGPGQPISCRTPAVRGVTVLPRQVMGGTAVKKKVKPL